MTGFSLNKHCSDVSGLSFGAALCGPKAPKHLSEHKALWRDCALADHCTEITPPSSGHAGTAEDCTEIVLQVSKDRNSLISISTSMGSPPCRPALDGGRSKQCMHYHPEKAITSAQFHPATLGPLKAAHFTLISDKADERKCV